jgi:CRISP-associated protein Cas1
VKRHLNTLYVTSQGAYLSKESETVVVSIDHEVRLQLPILTLSGIVCFGQVSMSPALMAFCAGRSVGISFLTEHGRFQARVVGPVSGNVLLRREQYRRADRDEASLAVARPIVAAKIASCRAVLLRSARDRPDGTGAALLEAGAGELGVYLGQLDRVDSVDSCRGLEGCSARAYFDRFDHLITQQKGDFFFHQRSRRPPLDRINALLSFVYTLLVHDVRGALECVGLDPAVGFLHEDRPGRPSLALDLMEELRPWFADRLVLSLVNLRQLAASDFVIAETGGVVLTDDGRKALLTAYQKRKQDEIQHPFLGEKTTVGLVPHLQALLLARHLRGDLDGYPPFVWK